MTNTELNEVIRKSKAAALREWRHKNPDKVRAQQARYWKRRALRELAQEQEQNAQDTQEGAENAEAEADS